MPTKHFELTSRYEEVEAVSLSAKKFFMVECGINDSSLVFLMDFSLRELLNNAIEHGNRMDECKKVTCELAYEDRKVSMDIFDEGEGFTLDDSTDMENIRDMLSKRTRGIETLRKIGFQLKAEGNHVYAKLDLNNCTCI